MSARHFLTPRSPASDRAFAGTPGLLAGGIALRVQDLRASLAFYTGVLGLPLGLAVPGYAEIDACGLVIELHDGAAPGAGLADQPAGMASIGLRVDDLEDALQCLRRAGLAFRREEDALEHRAHFHDPDGTPLYFVERK